MVTLSLCVDLISLKIACDFVMNSVYYSKNTSSEGWAKYFEITKQVLKSKMCEIILKSNNSAQLYFDMEGFIFIQFVAAFIPNHTRQINKQEETGFQK